MFFPNYQIKHEKTSVTDFVAWKFGSLENITYLCRI